MLLRSTDAFLKGKFIFFFFFFSCWILILFLREKRIDFFYFTLLSFIQSYIIMFMIIHSQVMTLKECWCQSIVFGNMKSLVIQMFCFHWNKTGKCEGFFIQKLKNSKNRNTSLSKDNVWGGLCSEQEKNERKRELSEQSESKKRAVGCFGFQSM